MKKRSLFLPLFCAFVLSVLFGSFAAAQEPIKIGFAYVFSERLAHYGFGAKQGAELAMDQINRAGGINGRKMVGVYEDTRLKPDVGVRVIRKMALDDRVDICMGIVSSAVASAVAPVMKELKTPLIITLAMTPDVTGSICNPYVFRVNINGPQNIKGAALLASQSQARRWTTVGPDYLFGYQCWEYFQKYLRDMKPDTTFFAENKTAYASMDTTDFSPYIKTVMDSNPDGVLVSLYGGNLVDFIRQGTQKGLFDKKIMFLMNLAYSADVMLGLGLDMPKGLWLGGLYWFESNPSPANKEFVEAYLARYKVFPDYNAHGAYVGVKTYAEAIKKAGTTDKEAIIKVLQGMTLDIPAGRMVIREGDHQAVYDVAWGMSSDFDGKLRIRSLKPLMIFPGTEVTPSVEATGCKMQ